MLRTQHSRHQGRNQRKISGVTEVTFGTDYDVINVQSTTKCDLFAIISSAATDFFKKSRDSQKNTRSEKNH